MSLESTEVIELVQNGIDVCRSKGLPAFNNEFVIFLGFTDYRALSLLRRGEIISVFKDEIVFIDLWDAVRFSYNTESEISLIVAVRVDPRWIRSVTYVSFFVSDAPEKEGHNRNVSIPMTCLSAVYTKEGILICYVNDQGEVIEP